MADSFDIVGFTTTSIRKRPVLFHERPGRPAGGSNPCPGAGSLHEHGDQPQFSSPLSPGALEGPFDDIFAAALQLRLDLHLNGAAKGLLRAFERQPGLGHRLVIGAVVPPRTIGHRLQQRHHL